MGFTIRTLFLGEDITAPETPGETSADGTVAIFACTTSVKSNDLEPPDGAHLETAARARNIPAGRYLFLQGFSNLNAEAFTAEAFGNRPSETSALNTTGGSASVLLHAAKELWLEALWQEINFSGQHFFLRILEEGGRCVFQLFRPIDQGALDPIDAD